MSYTAPFLTVGLLTRRIDFDNLVEMHWLDFAIIYFALGAPFGVLRVNAKRMATPFTFVRSVAGYLLWPLVATRNVARFFIAKPVAQKDELDAIRTELEKALFANSNAKDLYNFREVFFRYTGLAEAASEITQPLNNSALLNVARNTNHNLRDACLSRRDRQKFNYQFVSARQDFVEIITTIKNINIDEITFKLATYLNDENLASAIHSR